MSIMPETCVRAIDFFFDKLNAMILLNKRRKWRIEILC